VGVRKLERLLRKKAGAQERSGWELVAATRFDLPPCDSNSGHEASRDLKNVIQQQLFIPEAVWELQIDPVNNYRAATLPA
jgi:hypothetical protein